MKFRPELALLLLPAAVGLGLYWHALGYALLGYDAYPLIIASRVQSWYDFVGTFTEIMMDHRFPSGEFYRPTQNAIIAIEYALWATNPVGYQVTTLLLFATCITALVLLVRRLLNNDAIIAPLIAGLFFTLHPSHLTVLPAVARRIELLVMLAWLVALLVLPLRNQRGLIWRSILAAVLILFAAGAKENGLLGLGLIALHQLLFSAGSVHTRFKQAAIASTFATCSIAVYLIARFAVIGGAGGYQTTGVSFASWLANISTSFTDFVEAVLCPWNFLPVGSPQRVALVSLFVLTGLSMFAVVPSVRRAKPEPSHIGLLALGWAWAAANVLFNGFAETFNQRYVMLPTAGMAIVLSALAQWAISLAYQATPPKNVMVGEPTLRSVTKLIQLGSCSLLASIVVLSLQSSPLFIDYWEWREASRRENEFLVALDNVLHSAEPGTQVEAPRLPYIEESFDKNRPRLRIPVVLADYSIQAWAELHSPDRKIRVASINLPEIPPPQPDEILVIVRDQPAIIERFRVQLRHDQIDTP